MIGYRLQMAEHDEWMIEKEEMRKEEMGADYVPSPPEEDIQLVIKYTEPPMTYALLMFNEPPYVPCIVCKDAAAQFLDDGNVPHSREEYKRSEFEKYLTFCKCKIILAKNLELLTPNNLIIPIIYILRFRHLRSEVGRGQRVETSPRPDETCGQLASVGNVSPQR